MKLLLALLLSAPLAARAAKPAGPSLKGDGGVRIGMSRAGVAKTLEKMAGAKLEPYETAGCTTTELLTYSTGAVFATAVIRFDRMLGDNCEIPVRVDKLYNIELDYADGVAGPAVLAAHRTAFGKPFKQEGGPDSGVSYYEWRKPPYSTLLVINLRDGTAIRKEIRDIGVDKEIKKLERPLMVRRLKEKREREEELKRSTETVAMPTTTSTTTAPLQ
jgi:hypothetical protein